MPSSPLFGRRIHIAGSIADKSIASASDVTQTREVVRSVVIELVKRGATFVVPVDAEKLRDDEQPICFDWLVWDTISKNLHLRPNGAPNPLAIAVQHHKTEEQIPHQFEQMWDNLRNTDLVQIENAAHWNMNSKRMEAQARWGDILVTVGGAEGVLYLANLYHEAGKPVVPLNEPVGVPGSGSLRLFEHIGLTSTLAPRLFKTLTGSAHTWINRIQPRRGTPAARAAKVIELLEALEPPTAFVVRLLNPDHADFVSVQDFFDVVVQPVVENELGFKLVVIDGRQAYEHARIDQEIFAKLHRSRAVLADITGMRPNCFLELGYALGRQLPTMMMVKEGASHPFDLTTYAALHWKNTGSAEERRRQFREHWAAVQNRPPLVQPDGLIS